MTTIEFEPIGIVRSPEKVSRKGSFEHVVAELVLRHGLEEGLNGLDEFSHVEVIFYMHIPDGHGEDGPYDMMVHPMGRKDLPRVGLFATRSPHRPNRIGLTLCELISVKGNVVRVKGLDALDGSPVLDIKAPSLRYFGKEKDMRFADWTYKLRDITKEEG